MGKKLFRGILKFENDVIENVKRFGLVIKSGKIYRDMVELNGHEIVVRAADDPSDPYKYVGISPDSIKNRKFLPNWFLDITPIQSENQNNSNEQKKDLSIVKNTKQEVVTINTQNDHETQENNINFDDGIVGLKNSDTTENFEVKKQNNIDMQKDSVKISANTDKLEFIFMDEEEERLPVKPIQTSTDNHDDENIKNNTIKKDAVDIKENILKDFSIDDNNKKNIDNKQTIDTIKNDKKIEKSKESQVDPMYTPIDDKMYIATIKLPQYVFEVDNEIFFKDGSRITKKMVALEGKTLEFFMIEDGFVLNYKEQIFFKRDWLSNIKETVNWAFYSRKHANIFVRNDKQDCYLIGTLIDYNINNSNRFGIAKVGQKQPEYYKEAILVTTKNLAEILQLPPYKNKN